VVHSSIFQNDYNGQKDIDVPGVNTIFCAPEYIDIPSDALLKLYLLAITSDQNILYHINTLVSSPSIIYTTGVSGFVPLDLI